MELPECIHQHFGRLTNPTLEELEEALGKLTTLSSSVAPYVKEPDDYAYGRNVIYRNDWLEVIIIHLPANKETAIHDHGDSIGFARVIEGKLINSVYRSNQGVIKQVSSHLIRKRQSFSSTKGLIHKMTNPHTERMISLHVYSPPLQNVTVYQE
ncbi:cysteine dioxygenase family protein [Ammoniphilus sp. YIM 78166]|uniref:cysteine dioxygenase n=1 Tax=Ammoniphilus sp. YIM 78166 TaxID=1644106 RepID=UPI00106F2BEE|nr:cysteine dioxygenase family protein [Ammoniphilus sp. YIM 78166]